MSVQINVQASQTALAQSIQQGIAAFNTRYAGQNQLNLQVNARSFSQPLGRITSDLADFESALKASNARVLAFGASTAVLGGVVRSFKEIASVTIEVEKSLTDINRVLNLSTSGLQKFSSELFNISKQTASSFDDASKAALEFSRQGLNTQDTLKRTADALTLVRLTGISSTKAVEDLTATVNGFSKAGLTTSQVVNKLAAVEQDFAVSATDLTEALSRTGQAAQEAGVSFDELNALVTTAQQNTARGGAVIGNALKTIFTRLQRTETLDQLENFNIAVRDVQGNILPAVQILKNFADQYNNLADAQRAQLSEQVAGVYQVNILKGVISDLNNTQGTYAKALERGAMAANEADIANQRLNKTLDALVKQTGVGLQQLANNVGKVTFAPIFEAIVSPVNDAVSYINDTLEGEGIGSVFANGLLKGIRNVIAGPGLAVGFAVIAKVAKNTFEDATKALPAILGLTTESQKRANIEKSIISILQTQTDLSLALQGQQGNLSTQAATVLNYARLQTAQYQQQLQIAQQLAPLLAAQNVTVGARGIQVGARIKAGGHIPAFAEMSERMGAAMGGYKSGKVVKAPKSVGANTYMNSAEKVKYMPGFAQPFINPPANSKAGRAHRKNAISRTGVDPYMASGFLPNFSNPKDVIDKSFTGKLNFLKITSNTEKEEIQKVADLEIVKGIGKNAETINDNIAGTGIKYDVLEYQGSKTNEKYREEAAKLALSGKIDKITKAMPNNKKSLFNGKQWQDNLQTLKDNKIDLTNTALLSNLKLQVPSLSTGEMIGFGKQYTGLLNALSGEAFERDIAKEERDFIRSEKGNARLDFIYINKDQAYSGGEAKLGKVTLGNLVAKAIESTGRTYDNGDPDEINFSKPIKLFVPTKHKLLNNGFIPNFSPLIDDNARNKHDFPGGLAMLPIPDKALQNIVNRQKKRQMTYLDFDRTLVRTMGDIAYSRVSPDKRQGVLNKMFEKQEARLSDIKNSKLTQFGELLRQKINAGLIDPNLLGIMTASGKVEGMPEFISNVWKIPKANQVFRALPGTKEARLADLGVSASGFIPNFAISMQAARIPWFKKYSSLFKNSAGDKDVFRQKDFPTFGNGLDHRYAKEGNADVIGSLYEKFIRNAMNIARNSNVFKTNKEMGFDEMLTTTGNTAPFDFFENLGSGDFRGIQAKAGSKNNQSSGGGVTQTLTKNIARFAGTNPKDIDRLKEATLVYNDPKYIDPTGKNISARFTPFELSIAALVKDSFANVDPNIKPKLQQLTDSLLNQYNQIKNTTNPRINADGFIPNFANPKIKINSDKDAVESFYSKGSEVKGKKLTGGVKAFPVPETTDLYSVGSSSVSIPGSGFGISLYDAVLAEVSKKGAWLTSDRFTVSDKARRIWDGYRKLRKGDVKNKKLPMKHWFLDPAFNNGSYEFPMNPQDLSKNKSTWPPENDPVWSLQYAYQFKKSQLENKMSSGFIPNFANYNNDALERMTYELTQKGKKEAALQDFTQFVIDLNNNKYGVGDSFHKDIIAKNFGENVSDNDLVSPKYANTYLKGSYDKNSGKVIYYKSIAQQLDPLFERKHPYIKTVENELKVRFAKRQQYAPVKPRIQTDYGTFHKQHPGPSSVNDFNNGFIPNFADLIDTQIDAFLKPLSVSEATKSKKLLGQNLDDYAIKYLNKTSLDKLNEYLAADEYFEGALGVHFPKNADQKFLFTKNQGFIPNFNFIKGRNFFQKNWLIETAKKRNLNLNDPNVFHQLATEFAKIYPNDQGMFGLSKGFIPNFAYKQSVMSLEENMSGKNAILDTTTGPFPFIRNTGQPNFASAISDHGGLKNALNDSMRNQEAAGLINKGFVPNFATVDVRQALGVKLNRLRDDEQLLFVEMNKALSKLTRDLTLTSQQQLNLRDTVIKNASALYDSTKDINIVIEASKALAASLQQNSNAQQKAAAQTAKQTKAQQNISTGNQGVPPVQRVPPVIPGIPGTQNEKQPGLFEKIGTNAAFTIGVPLLAGQIESLITRGRERYQMSAGERFAATGVSAGLTGGTTGAMIGAAILPGVGAPIGAAVGAVVGLTAAAVDAKTNLDDLAKSAEFLAARNKSDIQNAQKYFELQKQLSSESDPFKVMEIKMAMEDAANGIKNVDFAKKILETSDSIEKFNASILEFSKSTRQLEILQRLPSIIKDIANQLKMSESGGLTGALSNSFSQFTNFIGKSLNSFYVNPKFGGLGAGIEAYAQLQKENQRKAKLATILASRSFTEFSDLFLDLEDQIKKNKPDLLDEYKNFVKNISLYRQQGTIGENLKPLVDANILPEETALKLEEELYGITQPVFEAYIENFGSQLQKRSSERVKVTAANAAKQVDLESLKNVFNAINISIDKSLAEIGRRLENIDLSTSLQKFDVEKIGEIFDITFSNLSKNFEDSAKSQLEFLSNKNKFQREISLLGIRETNFGATTQAKQQQFAEERSKRISSFLNENIFNDPESRNAAKEYIKLSRERFNIDIEGIRKLRIKSDETSKRALENLVESEKTAKANFDNQQKNAAILFDTEQKYALMTLKLKQKLAEADFKLDQRKLDNALKEKQVVESFNFANQLIEAKTQADINMMNIASEVNPNYNVGRSRFQQEDIKFKQEREKAAMQLAAGIRTSTNQAKLADFQQRILADNTQAIIENTNVTREANLIALRRSKSDIEENILNLSRNLQEQQQQPAQKISKDVSQNLAETISSIKPFYNTNDLTENKNFRFYDYKYVPESRTSFTYDQKTIAGMDANLQKSAAQNEPPSFFTQLLNGWIGNAKANQLPLETRSTQELIKTNEEMQKTINGIKPSQTVPTGIVPKKYTDENSFRFYLNKPAEILTTQSFDNQRVKILQEQVNLQEKAKNSIDDQIESTNGLLTAQDKVNQSLVERAVPDISKVGTAEYELQKLKESQDLLEQNKKLALDQLNASKNKPDQTIYDKNEQALLTQRILNYETEINKLAISRFNSEARITEEKKRQAEYEKYMLYRGKFTTGVAKAVGEIRSEAEMFKETLGTTTVNAFRDGLVGAMDAALNKADDLDSALRGVAAGFLREIQGVMLRNIANQFVSSIMPEKFAATSPIGEQKGGYIRAQKGMYISGGRTGDKNPALLEDGEYVLNRNAVKALGGPRAIDNLNFSAFPRFATGGDPGTMSASADAGAAFERLSMFGREQSPEFQTYMDKIREEEAIKEKKRAERKALLNQFLGTLITTGISMGLSSAFDAAKNASQATANLKGAVNTDTGVAINGFSDAKKIVDAGGSITLANGTQVNSSYFGGEAFTRSSLNQLAASRFADSGISGVTKSGYLVQGKVPYGTGKNEFAPINKTFKSPYDAMRYSQSLPSGFKLKPTLSGRRQEGGIIGLNQGGFLPYGSRLTDSIPAYLSGGEYVVNSRAVRKYGVGGLNRINSGVARFEDGGLVGSEGMSGSNTSNTSNSNIAINITVNATNGKSDNEQSDNNENGTEGNAKELSNRIKSVVLDVITNEQRTGGLLDSTKKK